MRGSCCTSRGKQWQIIYRVNGVALEWSQRLVSNEIFTSKENRFVEESKIREEPLRGKAPIDEVFMRTKTRARPLHTRPLDKLA